MSANYDPTEGMNPCPYCGKKADASQVWTITEPGEIIPSQSVKALKEQLDATIAELDRLHDDIKKSRQDLDRLKTALSTRMFPDSRRSCSCLR